MKVNRSEAPQPPSRNSTEGVPTATDHQPWTDGGERGGAGLLGGGQGPAGMLCRFCSTFFQPGGSSRVEKVRANQAKWIEALLHHVGKGSLRPYVSRLVKR